MYANYNSSMEAGLEQASSSSNLTAFDSFSNKSVRLAFIRKVYGILSLQLIITMAFVLAFSLSGEVKSFARANSWLLFLAIGCSFISLITLACCGVHRSFPSNLICLGLFTLSESIMIGFTTVYRQGETVLYAVVITAVIIISLTLFAFQTKVDLTVFNSILFVFLMVFMLFGILALFIHIKIVQLLYSAIGALLFSAYLVIDTQMIVGGNHKLQLSPEDYILGAITLYVDIVNIFIHILQLLDVATRN